MAYTIRSTCALHTKMLLHFILAASTDAVPSRLYLYSMMPDFITRIYIFPQYSSLHRRLCRFGSLSNIFTRNQRIMCQRSQKETKYTTHAHSHTHTPNNAKKESLDRIKWKVFYVRCGFDFFLSLSLCHSFSILLWSCVYRYCCCLHSFFSLLAFPLTVTF